MIAAEGQTVASWLRTIAGCTVGDERTLSLVVQRLTHLPTVSGWFADGTVSWAVVRSVVYATRRLTVTQLAWIDETLAVDSDRIRRDGDGVIGAVDRLAGDARPDLEADREQRLFDRRHLQVQAGMDGSVQLYGEFNAEMGAAILQALDTTPTQTDDPTDSDGDDDGGHGDADDGAAGVARPSRGQQRADALHALCLQRRAARGRDTANGDGADGVGRAGMSGGAAPAPARPSLLVLADIEALAGIGDTSPRVEHTAELLWRAARGPVRITNTALERMSCDADIRMIVTDGAVPLGVTTPTTNVGAPPPRGRPQRPRHTNTAHRAGAGAASGDPPTCPSKPDTTTIPAAP